MERHAEKPTHTFVAKSYCTGLAWSAVEAFHKPVIGHVIPNRKAARVALSKGASGLMVSGVLEVLE